MRFLSPRAARAFFTLAALFALAACGARTRLRTPAVDAAIPDAPPPDVVAVDTPVTFDVVDPCSRLGVDEMGCGFPDGTRIPFNEETTHGCIRCRCSESGGLFCTDLCGAPEDDAGPFMARRCLMPDGQRVFSPSWALVGTVWCYCDSGGGAQCRLPQCTDGGGALSPPPIVGPPTGCNSLSLLDAPTPNVIERTGAPPPAYGGPIQPGTYQLVEVVRYDGGPRGARASAVLQVDSAGVSVARYTANGAAIERASFEIENGPMGQVWWEWCPQSTRPRYLMLRDGGVATLPDGGAVVLDPGRPFYPVYSAASDSLMLFDPDTMATTWRYRRIP